MRQILIQNLKRARKFLRKAEHLLTSPELSRELAMRAETFEPRAAKEFYQVGILLVTDSIRDDLKLLEGEK